MNAAPSISIVSPVYHTGAMLEELLYRIVSSMPLSVEAYEVILVDDGSTDQSWNTVESVASKFPQVKGIRLTRNFGQHAAIFAGLANAKGEWIIVMDSDLQDLPEHIPGLINKADQHTPVVVARRAARKDDFVRRLASRIFYYLLSRLSDIRADHTVANFGIYHRQVVDTLVSMQESQKFFPMMVAWTGYQRAYLDLPHGERAEGKSGYTARKLVKLALQTTLSFSDKPLRYIIKAGMMISLLSVVYAMIVLVKYFSGNIIVLGYTSLIISIWFMGGLILFTLGIVGLYVGRSFEQVKKRPLYIIAETIHASNP